MYKYQPVIGRWFFKISTLLRYEIGRHTLHSADYPLDKRKALASKLPARRALSENFPIRWKFLRQNFLIS
jgi:hypothetical protein